MPKEDENSFKKLTEYMLKKLEYTFKVVYYDEYVPVTLKSFVFYFKYSIFSICNATYFFVKKLVINYNKMIIMR